MMQQYAVLKLIGKNEYIVTKSTDHCLLVLAHFLTDGGSQDFFRHWLQVTDKGLTGGQVIYINKQGDNIILGLDPDATSSHDSFLTTKRQLLLLIDRWQQERANHPVQVILRRKGQEIVFEIERGI